MPNSNKGMANRYGLNLKFYEYSASGVGETAAYELKFANEVGLEINGSTVWATGGQNHANRIPFADPKTGVLTISTQLVDKELLFIAAGGKVSAFTGNTIEFKNDQAAARPVFYKIEGETVWVDEDGVSHNETITCYKASIQPSHKRTYNGSGDPQSIDIIFDLSTDSDGNLVDFTIEEEAE